MYSILMCMCLYVPREIGYVLGTFTSAGWSSIGNSLSKFIPIKVFEQVDTTKADIIGKKRLFKQVLVRLDTLSCDTHIHAHAQDSLYDNIVSQNSTAGSLSKFFGQGYGYEYHSSYSLASRRGQDK